MPPDADWIVPQWPAGPKVHALITTRNGGVSLPPLDTFNLGAQVGDDTDALLANRRKLRTKLPAEPYWLRQVHGTRVVNAAEGTHLPEADACIATEPDQVCTVLVADCLPVLFCDRAGTTVAAAHAGWRGLSAGVLENTVAALRCQPGNLLAYLGPAIGPGAFEVGADVLEAFTQVDPGAADCFQTKSQTQPQEHKWFADLYSLARRRLARAGVTAVFGGDLCTFRDPERFFSHRRDKRTGRQAALIWLSA